MSGSELSPRHDAALMGAQAPTTPGAPPDAMAGAETVQLNLRGILETLRRNARLILGVTAITTAVAALIAFRSPPVYTAWALVRLQDSRTPLTRGIVDASDAGARLATDPVRSEVEVLMSRSLATQIAAHPGALPLRLHTDGFPQSLLSVSSVAPVDSIVALGVRFGADKVTVYDGLTDRVVGYGEPVDIGGARFSIDEAPEGQTEGNLYVIPPDAAVDSLLSGMQVIPRSQTDLLDVGFTARDPVVAASTANAIVEVFQEASAERAQQQARRRRIFMEEQLRQNDSILTAAQTALSRFRGRTQSYSSRDMFTVNQRSLADIDVQVATLEEERQTHRALLARLTADSGGRAGRAVILPAGIAENPVVAHLYAQMLRYQSSYDSLTTGEWRIAESSPDVRRLKELMASSRAQLIDAVRSYVSSVEARIAVLEGLKSTQAASFQELPAAEVEEAQLAMRLDALRKVGDQLREEYQKTRIDEAVEAGQIQVIDAAVVPKHPSGLGAAYIVGIGLILGLVLGGGGAFVREAMNTAIRGREEVEDLLQMPWLAVIPRIRSQSSTGHARRFLGNGGAFHRDRHRERRLPSATTSVEQGSQEVGEREFAADAFRVLQVNLGFASPEGMPRVIAVTSATAQDGKTTTAINLAAAYAEQDLRVLLVDCDLRRPRLHRLSRQPRDPGLVELLLGRHTPEEVTRPLTGNLWLLAAGATPPNPPALLGSTHMRDLVQQLAHEYDVLVLDCPPALLGADAALVSMLSDGVLFVVRAGRTDRALAQDALRQLRRVGVRLLGAALNDPDATMPQYSYDSNETYKEYYYEQMALSARQPKSN